MTGHITHKVRARILKILGGSKTKHVDEYLGCTYEFFRGWIKCQLRDGMTMQNVGEWHIDHIIPIKYGDCDDNSIILQRLHYSNCWPMWGSENMSKGNRSISVLPPHVVEAREKYLNDK